MELGLYNHNIKYTSKYLSNILPLYLKLDNSKLLWNSEKMRKNVNYPLNIIAHEKPKLHYISPSYTRDSIYTLQHKFHCDNLTLTQAQQVIISKEYKKHSLHLDCGLITIYQGLLTRTNTGFWFELLFCFLRIISKSKVHV